MIEQMLPELTALERLIASGALDLKVHTACTVSLDGRSLPVYTLAIGDLSPDAPAVSLCGGIHELERIGTQVLLSFLEGLLARLRWDHMLHQQLAHVRLVCGLFLCRWSTRAACGSRVAATRSNLQGIDLMRNAPVESSKKVPFLLGG
jgi:hypothetical protein